MNGTSHQFVAHLALACLDIRERHILYPRWGGIESGSTLSDEFRLMWESESIENITKQLVHRYFVDSKNPKDHGGVSRAWDHASGSVSFIEDYIKDPNSYGTEVEFLENLGMYLGITSHRRSLYPCTCWAENGLFKSKIVKCQLKLNVIDLRFATLGFI